MRQGRPILPMTGKPQATAMRLSVGVISDASSPGTAFISDANLVKDLPVADVTRMIIPAAAGILMGLTMSQREPSHNPLYEWT